MTRNLLKTQKMDLSLFLKEVNSRTMFLVAYSLTF